LFNRDFCCDFHQTNQSFSFQTKPNQPKAAKKAAEEKAKKDEEEYNDGAGTGFYRCVRGVFLPCLSACLPACLWSID